MAESTIFYTIQNSPYYRTWEESSDKALAANTNLLGFNQAIKKFADKYSLLLKVSGEYNASSQKNSLTFEQFIEQKRAANEASRSRLAKMLFRYTHEYKDLFQDLELRTWDIKTQAQLLTATDKKFAPQSKKMLRQRGCLRCVRRISPEL